MLNVCKEVYQGETNPLDIDTEAQFLQAVSKEEGRCEARNRIH